MNEEDKIHINSFKFYDRDELEELTKEYYLENEQLKENNLAMQEEMARTWAKLQQKEDILEKAKEYIKKHLNAKSYGNHKYELFSREYLGDLLEILDNKGE